MLGERHHESTSSEGALGLMQRAAVVAEPVKVAVALEFPKYRGDGCVRPRIARWKGTAHAWEQQGGVHASIDRGSLPCAVGTHARAGHGAHDLICEPPTHVAIRLVRP